MGTLSGMATITQTNGKTWKAIVRKARFGVRLKVKTFSRKSDAEAWARKTESEIERGVWRDVGGADRMTLGEALDKYEKEVVSNHRVATASVERAILSRVRAEPLSRVVLDKITRGNVRAMLERWRSEGFAIATINRRLTVLHRVFDVARDTWGMASLDNPADKLRVKGAERRERRVSDEEIEALADASKSPVLAAAMRLAVETAMRRGELCQLAWSMIDSSTHVAKLPAAATKAARSRAVPLSPAAIEILDALPRNGPVVLGGLRPHSITRALERAAKRGRIRYLERCALSGMEPEPGFLEDLHFHDLRHEAATRLARIFGLHELMKIVGHASSAMLERYYHPDAAAFAARMRKTLA